MANDEQEIVGNWKVSFRGLKGSWKWEYTFSADHSVKWRDPLNNMTGSGRWLKQGKLINVSWFNSTTKESWSCPVTPDGQKGWIDASYGVGPFQAEKIAAPAATIGPQADPSVANVSIEKYVDNFAKCVYDLNYKIPPNESFAYSSLLQVQYDDGTKLEFNINKDFSVLQLAHQQAFDSMVNAYIGPGGRIFPKIMAAATVPNLWMCRDEAFRIQNEDWALFAGVAVAGVAFILSIPAMMSAPVEPGVLKRARVTRTRTTGVAAAAAAATIRSRATQSQLRQMLSNPDNIYVWACQAKDVGVVENQTIKFTGETARTATPKVHLLKGRSAILGQKYGPNKVAIDGSKYPVRQVLGRNEEFYIDAEIQASEGLWFNDSDLIGIGALPKR